MQNNTAQFPLLMSIDSPEDLRGLPEEKLAEVADEIRNYMVDTLDQCGGHFAASLGTVEITIALHYLYNTPSDRIIWDVGHQAYPHKILTGRRDLLSTVKQRDGLAPFPKRDESEYDAFGTGHSSTSISAALGMAIASSLDNIDRKSIAVIGDGGLTGGMAFEALNHGGAIDPNMLVILNDNDMSISNNVGALTHYLGRILSGKLYTTLREGSKKVLEKMPPVSRLAKRTETHIKGMVTPGTIFEELGFNYLGPIDGHDLPTLLKTLRNIKKLRGAKLLHIITTKGKGYEAAEKEPIKYHAVKPGFHSKTQKISTKNTSPTYTQVFGEWLCDMAKQDKNLVGITPAMCEGSGLVKFAKAFPERYHDVGIAEQHCVTFAAGLACEHKKPVVAIYSSFLQRAYDQLIHDVTMQNLDVTFAIDRAGLVGGDSPTHGGCYDISFLRCIPNMVVMAPADESECRDMLTTAYQHPGPAAVRYPRGQGPGANINKKLQALPIGKGEICRRGTNVAILAFGPLLQSAIEVANTLNATVANMRFIKPIDKALISELAEQHNLLVTIEDNVVMGGAGSAVGEYLHAENLLCPLLQLGIPDMYIKHGSRDIQLQDCGLDADALLKSIRQRMQTLNLTKIAS